MIRFILPLVLCSLITSAQGYIELNNKVTGLFETPILRGPGLPLAGQGPGAGFTAQLYLISPEGSLEALTPTTTFRTSPIAATPYLVSIVFQVPGVPPGVEASFRLRVYETIAGSYEAAIGAGKGSGESKDIPVILGESENLPGLLRHLKPFTITVPEPDVVSLALAGAIAFIGLAKWRRQR